ncbi:MAG: site-2 protease family protein [Pseudomonadota bacterium]
MPTLELIQIGLTILALFTLCTYTYALIVTLLAALLNIKVREVLLGFGKPLLQFDILGRTISICSLPLGTSVSFVEGEAGFDGLSKPYKLIFRVTGEIIFLAAAFLYVSDRVVDLPQQVIGTVFALFHSPYDTARAVAGDIVQIIRTESAGTIVALAFALQAVINLLPIPPLNGGLFLIELLEWITGTTMELLRSGPIVLVSLLVIIYAFGWVVAGFFLI